MEQVLKSIVFIIIAIALFGIILTFTPVFTEKLKDVQVPVPPVPGKTFDNSTGDLN